MWSTDATSTVVNVDNSRGLSSAVLIRESDLSSYETHFGV
jgi:hypothetical protein